MTVYILKMGKALEKSDGQMLKMETIFGSKLTTTALYLCEETACYHALPQSSTLFLPALSFQAYQSAN